MYTIQATDGVGTQEKRLMGYNTQIVDDQTKTAIQ